MQDDRVCPVCRQLEGYTWVFEVGAGELNGILTHPQIGEVWTLDQGSRAHGHKGNCRCSITYLVDVKTILERVKAIRDTILNMVSEG
jgi:hypothetical protein